MKKAIALVMTAVMALATPASVLAEEWDGVIISEEAYEESEEYVAPEEPAAEIDNDSAASEIIIDDEFQEIEEEPLPEENSGIEIESVPEEIQNQESGAEIVIEGIEEVPTDSYDISTYEVSTLSEVASGTCGENLTWVLDDEGTLTISGIGDMDDFWGETQPWLGYDQSVVSLVIEEGVTNVSEYAFSGCDSLTAVTIPISLTDIEAFAFENCDSILDVYYNGTKDDLAAVRIANYNDSLKETVFHFNDGTDGSITEIGTCGDGLYWILFGDGDLIISGTGDMDEWLGSAPWAWYIDSINSVEIKTGVASIGSYAFDDYSNLTTLTIPASVTYIGYYAFNNCYSISEIYYEGSEEDWLSINFGEQAFKNVSATIYYNGSDNTGTTKEIPIANGTCGDDLTWVLDNGGTLTISGSGAMTNWSSTGTAPWSNYLFDIYSVIVEPGVTSIGDMAFSNSFNFYYSIETVSLPDTLIYIGDYAFRYCSDMTSIEIPEGVISIGEYAFDYCLNLTSISLPSSLKSIGSRAFSQSGLTSIEIPYGVSEIANYVFNDCGSLTNIVIPSSITSIGQGSFSGCKSLTSANIPDSVKSIGQEAFENCVNITSVKIPDSVTYMGPNVFSGCYKLASVELSKNLSSINQYAFQDCTGLTDIVIPDNIVEIGGHAFYNCSSMTSITFSNSVAGIGEAAFDCCTDLADVYFEGSESDWKAINIATGNLSLTNATIHYSVEDPVEISDCTVTLSFTSYTYDGSAKKPSVTVKKGSTTLISGTDYTVSYSNNTNAGTATVTITGKGDYTGTTTKNFTINKASQTLTVVAAASSIGVGKTTTITASGKGTITYSSGNTSVATVSSSGVVTGKVAGTATITVKAAGNSNYNSASTTIKITVLLKKGSSYTSGDFVYKILTLPSSGTGTVQITGPAKTSIKTADIPEKVTIGGRSFKVTEIGAKAFKGCTKLKTVTVGKNVTAIGSQAFSGCTKMTGISIKTGLTTIGKKAFYNCKTLKTITIKSKKLTSVGSNAFKGIKSNAKIKVPSSKLKAYTKLLKGKGQGSKVKITS